MNYNIALFCIPLGGGKEQFAKTLELLNVNLKAIANRPLEYELGCKHILSKDYHFVIKLIVLSINPH